MNETSDRDLIESMRRTLYEIHKIETTTPWRLAGSAVYGWGFVGEDGDWYAAVLEDDVHAAWEALEKSDRPDDIALMQRIRAEEEARAAAKTKKTD